MKNDWVDNTFIKVVNVLENHAYPYIGNKSIKDITRTDILNIIDRMNKKVYLGVLKNLSLILIEYINLQLLTIMLSTILLQILIKRM